MERAFASFLRLDRRLWLLALARSINTMGFSLVMPFLAMYLVQERGATAAVYGSIFLVSGLAAAFGQGLSGELSDRFGRRRIMIGALATRAVVMCLLGLAVTVHAPVLAIGALVVANGFLRAQFDPAAAAAVADLAPPELRVSAFGLQRMGVNLGWSIGPALGGLLAAGGYGRVFFLGVPATVVAILAVARVGDVERPGAAPKEQRVDLVEALRSLSSNRPFLSYLVLVLAGSAVTVQMFSVLSIYASGQLGLTRAQVGLVYMVNGVLVLLLQVPAVALIGARGMGRSLVLGAGIYAASYLAIGASTSFGTLAASVALITVGEVIFAPALSDAAATLGDPRRMGRAFGLFGLTQQLGISMGPLLGGALYDAVGNHHMMMWGTVSASMVLVGLGYAAFLRRVSVEPVPAGAA